MGVEANCVDLSITIFAKPSTVYRVFTDPVRFAKWWSAPGGGRAMIEPRVGGMVRIEYQGGHATASGQVLEMVEGKRFVFSWGYEKGNDAVKPGESRVEIDLVPVEEGTKLMLRHLNLPTEEQRLGHRNGWRHYLSCMAKECAADEFGGVVGSLTASWCRAWSTMDAAQRLGLLRECCEDGVTFHDAYSAVEGVAVLNDHIGNALRHMPGKLEAVGEAQLCHAFVRFAWRAVGADGKVMFSGQNFGKLTPSQKFASVAGFWG